MATGGGVLCLLLLVVGGGGVEAPPSPLGGGVLELGLGQGLMVERGMEVVVVEQKKN